MFQENNLHCTVLLLVPGPHVVLQELQSDVSKLKTTRQHEVVRDKAKLKQHVQGDTN